MSEPKRGLDENGRPEVIFPFEEDWDSYRYEYDPERLSPPTANETSIEMFGTADQWGPDESAVPHSEESEQPPPF